MGIFGRWTRAGRKPHLGDGPVEPAPPAPEPGPAAAAEDPGEIAGTDPDGEENPAARARGLSGWVEQRAQRVVEQVYQARAAELEERAQRVMSSVYERTADDLEERAVRAMRRALEAEAERIKDAIEHGIAIKKREVRLSLLVLVVSSLIYLALYWFTHGASTP